MLIPVKRWRTEASLSLVHSFSLSLSVLYWLLLQYAAARSEVGGRRRRDIRGVGGGVFRNDNPIWRRYGCSTDRAQPGERSATLQAAAEPRIGRRGRRGGRWELVPALGMQKHTVRQIGVSDGKHGTGFGRPIKLQNSRPRAPPAVYRGFPFASTTGGKFRTTPSPVDFILSLCTNQKRFDFLSFFFVSVLFTHTLLVCVIA